LKASLSTWGGALSVTPSRQQGIAFGFYNGALGVGALIASIGFGDLYQRFSPAIAFATAAALAGVAAVLLLFVPTTRTRD